MRNLVYLLAHKALWKTEYDLAVGLRLISETLPHRILPIFPALQTFGSSAPPFPHTACIVGKTAEIYRNGTSTNAIGSDGFVALRPLVSMEHRKRKPYSYPPPRIPGINPILPRNSPSFIRFYENGSAILSRQAR